MNKDTIYPASVSETLKMLKKQNFVADDKLVQMIFLSLSIKRPLLLEGPSGIGKTGVALAIANGLGRPLIKLQCYEGLGVNEAVYDWNYAGQLLSIKMHKKIYREGHKSDSFFNDKFLIKRPLLKALQLQNGKGPVLLIDEIDRADPGLEAILLEILAENQFTIPEIGSVIAQVPPIVIVTSNGTRTLHNALRRRCLFHYLSWSEFKQEKELLESKIPNAYKTINLMIDSYLDSIRMGSTVRDNSLTSNGNWASTLSQFNAFELSPERVSKAFKLYFNYREKLKRAEKAEISDLLKLAQKEFKELSL